MTVKSAEVAAFMQAEIARNGRINERVWMVTPVDGPIRRLIKCFDPGGVELRRRYSIWVCYSGQLIFFLDILNAYSKRFIKRKTQCRERLKICWISVFTWKGLKDNTKPKVAPGGGLQYRSRTPLSLYSVATKYIKKMLPCHNCSQKWPFYMPTILSFVLISYVMS